MHKEATMVDWEKGAKEERDKWQKKIKKLIIKIDKGNRESYNKYVVVDLLKRHLLEDEEEK